MTKNSFTPSPWIIDHEWKNGWQLQGYEPISGAIGQPDEHRALAQVVVKLDGEKYNQGLANAALIAADPDLYEALESAIPFLASHPTDAVLSRLKDAEAALKKARGET